MVKTSQTIILAGIISVSLYAGCASMPFGKSLANTPPSATPDYGTVRFQDEGSFARTPAAFQETPKTQARPNQSKVVKQVVVTGNQMLAEHEIMRRIKTRPGRYFDPDLLQQDVNELWKLKQIRRVKGPFLEHHDDGVIVKIEVTERPYINEVKYIGNRALADRKLAEETGLAGGQPLDLHAVKMARTRLEDLYAEEGFPRTQVSIVEGDEAGDRNVTFLIYEDALQRVASVKFEGNKIARDARLKSFVKIKPGILWYVGGKVNRRELEQDKLRLETYYRSLGFFNARIGRELIENEKGNWLTIRYTINEGPRYKIRNVSFIGNEKYNTDELNGIVKMRPNGELPEFNASKMNEDVQRLEDLYGSQGFVFAKVQAEPRFLEEPGLLDLVYNISEGKRYRVGEVNIVIEGDYGVTQRQVVLNRLGLRPGDWLDTRKIREAEARLRRSQLFADGSAASPGNPPRIAIRPPEMNELQGNGRKRR